MFNYIYISMVAKNVLNITFFILRYKKEQKKYKFVIK